MPTIPRVAQVLLGALAITTAAAVPASAVTTPNTATTAGYTIHSAATSAAKCVGLANNGSTANGTKLVLWDCHLHPDQRWNLA